MLVVDFEGRVASLGPTLGPTLCSAVLVFVFLTYPLCHYFPTSLVLLLRMVCEILVEEMQAFHRCVDEIFAHEGHGVGHVRDLDVYPCVANHAPDQTVDDDDLV